LRSYIQRWSIIKNLAENISDKRAIDAFAFGLCHSDLVEEQGRIRPRTVSELMEIANRFADGEDAYHNKRACSPEHDRSSRYNNQRRRSRNVDSRILHNQVATGYRRSNKEGGEHKIREYHKKDNSRGDKSRYFDPSAEDILNGPCRIHYAYLDGKRVSNHLMRDCRKFVKLQEAMELNQGAKLGSTAYGKRTIHQGYPTQSGQGYPQSKVYISAMIQPVPKSKKEQKNISRQVNLAISSPPATTEYLRWSDQTVRFSREDHLRKVPRPGHTTMVLKAQIRGYDIGQVFMDAGSGINLIYARTLKAMNISLEWLQPTDCSFHGIVPGSANHPLGELNSTFALVTATTFEGRGWYLKSWNGPRSTTQS
jgi:hypothetical protein